jgi:hypothetical protein
MVSETIAELGAYFVKRVMSGIDTVVILLGIPLCFKCWNERNKSIQEFRWRHLIFDRTCNDPRLGELSLNFGLLSLLSQFSYPGEAC